MAAAAAPANTALQHDALSAGVPACWLTKANYLRERVAAGIKPTLSQLNMFLEDLVQQLGRAAAVVRTSAARIAWDIEKNQSRGETPPTLEAVLVRHTPPGVNVLKYEPLCTARRGQLQPSRSSQ